MGNLMKVVKRVAQAPDTLTKKATSKIPVVGDVVKGVVDSKQSLEDTFAPMAGAAAGTLYGGPAGAALGKKLGSEYGKADRENEEEYKMSLMSDEKVKQGIEDGTLNVELMLDTLDAENPTEIESGASQMDVSSQLTDTTGLKRKKKFNIEKALKAKFKELK